jgi:uncharacterized membrane protein
MRLMEKGRLEAFSDGVMAIIITIMTFELKVPHGTDIHALRPLLPIFLSYLLSFIYIGIYWNNHHHLIKTADQVDGPIMWANLHLLFWLSLIPFATGWLGQNHLEPALEPGPGWIGENHLDAAPTAFYGCILLMSAVAYWLLQCAIVSATGSKSILAIALGSDWKGKFSPVFYFAAISLSFVNQWIAVAIYVFVAMLWIIPDRRISKALAESPRDTSG